MDRQYLREASSAQLRRRTTKARIQGTRDWVASHARSSRRYRPPTGSSIRPDLKKERKELHSREILPAPFGTRRGRGLPGRQR